MNMVERASHWVLVVEAVFRAGLPVLVIDHDRLSSGRVPA